MLRRSFFSIASGAAFGLALPARAQTAPKVYRVGVLATFSPRSRFPLADAMRDLGYEEGRNIVYDYQLAEGNYDRLGSLAAELVARKVDLIVALSNWDAEPAKRLTSTIPIVVVYSMAPVENGLVQSLARPGGNVTGTTVLPPEAAGKSLQLLRDVVPRASRMALLVDPDSPNMDWYIRATERAAKAMNLRLVLYPLRNVAEIDAALAAMSRDLPHGMFYATSGANWAHRARMVEFAAQHRLPTIYVFRGIVAEGGLMAYYHDDAAQLRRSASMVDRLLKGAKPADIPFEEPTKYEFVINLKTARDAGLTIPLSLRLQATEVIQ